MEHRAETSVLFLIRPISLAASFAFAILLFCCRGDNAFMLYFDLYNMLDELIAAFGLGAIVGSVAIALAPTETVRARRTWTVLSTACCIAAVVCALASGPTTVSRTAYVCGCLLGFGTTGLVAQWCVVFAKLPRRALPFTIALSFFFGSCLWLVMQIVGGFVPVCVALVVFSLCGGLMLFVAIASGSSASRDAEDAGTAAMVHGPAETQGAGAEGTEGGPSEPAARPADATGDFDAYGTERPALGAVPREQRAGGSDPAAAGYIRPALTLLDSFLLRTDAPISRSHAFEALGAAFVSFFILGVHYWPDSAEIVYIGTLMKPLAYALASILVLMVSARGYVSSLASGGMDRLRRNVLICASLLLAVSAGILLCSSDGLAGIARFLENLSLDTLLLFGLITSFIHLMRHGFSPTSACALLMLQGCVSVSLGIAAFVLFDSAATAIGAGVAGIYGVTLLVLSIIEKRQAAR